MAARQPTRSNRPTARRPPTKRRTGRKPDWVGLPDEELLDRTIRSLGLQIEGTALEGRVERLYAELESAGLRFRPYVWLSTDWFTPDGVTGFAIPFFLAHPRLARLERRRMLEVEGGTMDSCLKLLRHETAHALDNAYRLHRRKRWREVFGAFTQPYRMTYVPRPTSKNYVQNLDYWYSQSHPCEDFAETFSVWLRPRSRWRQRYRGWPALKKLEFVDELVTEVRDRVPPVKSRSRPESVGRLGLTLREYYARKQARYHGEHTTEYDPMLRRVFAADDTAGRRQSAARFLEHSRRELRQRVAVVTGQHQYVIDQVVNELILRCRILGLRLSRPPKDTLIEAASLLTVLTTRFVRRGRSEYRR
jgi:hypothetical protein